VRTHRPPAAFGYDHVDARVSAGASAAVAYWKEWERRQASHAETVAGMNLEFAKMKRALDERPTTGNGFGWGVLGALHMNTHKLLENVLLEAESYLGLALTFGGESAAFAEQNLEGCYAKRQLEAAKYLWFAGMEKALRGIDTRAEESVAVARGEGGEEGEDEKKNDRSRDATASGQLLAEAEALFVRSAAKKNGWGWGVNNGEIFLAEACVKLLKGDHEDEEEEEEACAAVEKAVHRNARLPFTVYLQSVCKNLKKNKKDKEEFDRSRVVLTKLASKTRSWMVSMLARAQPKPSVVTMPSLPWSGKS
jgi:hypothetical protein